MSRKIILVGNPNTGKTTLFNTLTNSDEKVSNWHGVTVGEVSKKFTYKNEEYVVSDIPGMYSIEGFSNEEKIASKILEKNKNELIVNVCDANNLRRNFILTKQLIDNGYKIIIVVNMVNENSNYDLNKLSKETGVNVVGIDARNKKNVENLLKIIKNTYNEKPQNIYKNNEKDIDINKILQNSCKNTNITGYEHTDKIDKFILNKWLFLLIFISTIFIIFYITFGPVGNAFSYIINYIFNKIIYYLQKLISCVNISNIIKIFLFDGVFVAIESVLSFVPQIILLMSFFNLLEDVGFMSRVAFMFDGVLKNFGLTGKSLFSLIMGYGCTTSAVMTTRNLENRSLRKRTILILPFMTCSAKIPIFLVISSLFFEKYKFIFVFALYIFACVLSLFFAYIYKKIIPDKNADFILEMPKYRLPNVKKIIKDTSSVLKEFLIKIGTMILLFSIIVWILRNFTPSLQFLNGGNFDKSILYILAEKLTFIFKPLGLNNVGIVIALILGVVAKEMIVVGLAMINGVSGLGVSLSLINASSICSFNLVSSIVFLVFVLIYSPCISSVISIKNEIGFKTAIYVFVSQFLIAYLVSFIVFKTLTDFRYIFAFGFFLVLAILLSVVLRLKSKNNCRGNCNACRRV